MEQKLKAVLCLSELFVRDTDRVSSLCLCLFVCLQRFILCLFVCASVCLCLQIEDLAAGTLGHGLTNLTCAR